VADGGRHFGERFQLFVIIALVIIALGESVVLAGATASDTGLSVDVVAALLLAFLSSTALWWLYFGQLAGTVLERIRAASAGERARSGATSTPTSIFRSSLGSCSSQSATSS
jgi:low temperature requirement protein LtrA